MAAFILSSTACSQGELSKEKAVDIIYDAAKVSARGDFDEASKFYTKNSDELQRLRKMMESVKKMGLGDGAPQVEKPKPDNFVLLFEGDKAMLCSKSMSIKSHRFKKVDKAWLIHGLRFDPEFQGIETKCVKEQQMKQ